MNIVPICMIGIYIRIMIKKVVFTLLILMSITSCSESSLFKASLSPLHKIDLDYLPEAAKKGYYNGSKFQIQNREKESFLNRASYLELDNELMLHSRIYRKFQNLGSWYYGIYFRAYLLHDESLFVHHWKIRSRGLPFSKARQSLTDAPPGPPEFREGWKDGCDAGTIAGGNLGDKFLRYKKSFYYNPKYIDVENDRLEPKYYKGFYTALWACGRQKQLEKTTDKEFLY